MINELSAIRIVVADVLPEMRSGLRRVLASDPRLCIVGEASSASEVAHLIRHTQPNILLIDLELSLQLRAPTSWPNSSPTRTLVMIASGPNTQILEALSQGAHGIVHKSSEPRVFLESICSVMAGQYWMEQESLGFLVGTLREVMARGDGASSSRDYGLTRRELDIIARIVRGRSNKEVGEDFRISERTVKHHLTNIFGKVGVTSRLQLALFAMNHQLMVNEALSTPLQQMRSEEEA